MSADFLSQEEIDALLRQTTQERSDAYAPEAAAEDIDELSRDALGEIGNITMGTAATALSTLLNQRVTITTPRVWLSTKEKLLGSFDVPHILVEVNFTQGLGGSNLLVVRADDAAIIADLMMGGSGHPSQDAHLSELHLSAIAEAMNQMMGSAATSMSSLFNAMVTITPPAVSEVRTTATQSGSLGNGQGQVVVVAFRMEIGQLIDSEIMQVIPLETARHEVALLTEQGESREGETNPPNPAPTTAPMEEAKGATQTGPGATPALSGAGKARLDTRNLDLLLDVPLQVTVILGATQKPFKEVNSLGPGSIVELQKLAEEPVDILVNGKLIAQGEVVVINESFGVRITNILTPADRLAYLSH